MQYKKLVKKIKYFWNEWKEARKLAKQIGGLTGAVERIKEATEFEKKGEYKKAAARLFLTEEDKNQK